MYLCLPVEGQLKVGLGPFTVQSPSAERKPVSATSHWELRLLGIIQEVKGDCYLFILCL